MYVLQTSSCLAATPDWQKLESAQLVGNDWNDGDSFHVQCNGEEYIFRLYFVDCPETDLRFPERVAEQGSYFGISTDKALDIGKQASAFTSQKLRQPFTVFTCWQKALGSSKLQRYYALILTQDGWLDQMLVKNGLARVYGKRITLPNGADSRTYRDQLFDLESNARSGKIGAWSDSH